MNDDNMKAMTMETTTETTMTTTSIHHLSEDELRSVCEFMDLRTFLHFSLCARELSTWLTDASSVIWSPSCHWFSHYTQLRLPNDRWQIGQYVRRYGTHKSVIQQFLRYRFLSGDSGSGGECGDGRGTSLNRSIPPKEVTTTAARLDEEKRQAEKAMRPETMCTLMNERRTVRTTGRKWHTVLLQFAIEDHQVYEWDFVLDEYTDDQNRFNVFLGVGPPVAENRIIGYDREMGVSLNVGQMSLHYGSHRATMFSKKNFGYKPIVAKSGDVFSFKVDTKGNRFVHITMSNALVTIKLNGKVLTSAVVNLERGSGSCDGTTRFYPGISLFHTQQVTLRPSYVQSW